MRINKSDSEHVLIPYLILTISAIFRRRCKLSVDGVANAILNVDYKRFTIEDMSLLLQLVPTDEEVKQFVPLQCIKINERMHVNLGYE